MAQIEALLADDPTDPFLRYGLAMEYVSAGDDATAAEHLVRLTADSDICAGLPPGRAGAEPAQPAGEAADALRGNRRRPTAGRTHAEGEMAGLLATL